MDEFRYWAMLEDVWQEVDGRVLVDALSRGVPPIEDRVRQLLTVLIARLDALPLEEARSVLEHHRASIRAIDREATLSAVGAWMYDRDDNGLALVPLFGEAFYRRVVSAPDTAAALPGARGLEALGGWRPLTEPVRIKNISCSRRQSLLEGCHGPA